MMGYQINERAAASVPDPSSYPFRSVAREPSLSDRVAEQLTEAIVSRQIPAGERLPSERELGDRFRVSRTVVREAVRSLAARGLVRVTSGRGVEVNEIGASNVAASMRLLVRGHQGLDYGKVNVKYTPGDGTKPTVIPKVEDRMKCGTGLDAWYYDDNALPTQVVLCSDTCTTLRKDMKGQVDIVLGCDTVVK